MSALDEFRNRLFGEWLKPFCDNRGYAPSGFVSTSIEKLSEADAHDFMDAIDSGLVIHQQGAFVAACSNAKEYIFWEGARSVSPRKITLWLEPLITIAGLRRMQRKFGWPSERLGMQSATWAFDFVGYKADQKTEVAACEVKRTRRELDDLLVLMRKHRATPADALDDYKAAERNALKKVIALRQSASQIFWALGPDNYGHVFAVERDALGEIDLTPTSESALFFELNRKLQ